MCRMLVHLFLLIASVSFSACSDDPAVAGRFSSVTVHGVGLPSGAVATVVLRLSGGVEEVKSLPATISSVPAGSYTIDAPSVDVNEIRYRPMDVPRSIDVPGASSVDVVIAYQAVEVEDQPQPQPQPYPPPTDPDTPRVWMTPERIAHLKDEAAANSTRWQSVLAAANIQVARGNQYSYSDVDAMPALCIVYLVTNDQRYANRVGDVITKYAVEENDLRSDQGYNYRSDLRKVTAALDWCRKGLSNAQRTQAATWLMNRADWVWPETNPSRTSGWGLWPSSNYYWGFMYTGPAALAAAGSDTGSSPLSGRDRPTFHKQLILDRWHSEAAPFLSANGKGGAWREGTNYESTERVAQVVDGYATAGIDITHPFLRESLLWRIHSTMPGGKYKALFGAQPRVSDAPTYLYDRHSALWAMTAASTGDDTDAMISYWLDMIGHVPSAIRGGSSAMAAELLLFDPEISKATGTHMLPLMYHAEGPGFVVGRASWDGAGMAWTFEAGPQAGEHGGLNANGFNIWGDGYWVSAGANLYSHSGIIYSTKYNNNLLVNGEGQRFGTSASPNRGNVMATQIGDGWFVVRGQAKDAYGTAADRPLADYLRTVVAIPSSGTYVVLDRVGVKTPSVPLTWLWHSKGEPELGSSYIVLKHPSNNYRCFVTVMSSMSPVVAVERFEKGLSGSTAATSYAATVTIPGKLSDVVATVFECGSASVPSITPSRTIDNGVVTIELGAVGKVMVPLDENLPVTRQ